MHLASDTIFSYQVGNKINFRSIRVMTLKIDCFHRLDQILGKQGSKAKDVYASKISLASRVVKVERQVRCVLSLSQIRNEPTLCCYVAFTSHVIVNIVHDSNLHKVKS
jgi:hypothetical protein